MYIGGASMILIAAAVIPAVILMVRTYRTDRLEPEPKGFLVGLILIGIFSTTLAAFSERILLTALSFILPADSLIFMIIEYFGIVALSEEGFKYMVLKRRTWNSPHFNCQYDGLIYSVFVALGFALWENIMYVLQYGLMTALLRAVTAVPAHASFGVFMGVFYGMAKKAETNGDYEGSKSLRTLAVLFPAVIHGAYDFIATIDRSAYSAVFFLFVLIMFVIALGMQKRAARSDSHFDELEVVRTLGEDEGIRDRNDRF